MAESVVNCEPTVMSILKAYKKINMKSFKLKLKKVSNPYYLKIPLRKYLINYQQLKFLKVLRKILLILSFKNEKNFY